MKTRVSYLYLLLPFVPQYIMGTNFQVTKKTHSPNILVILIDDGGYNDWGFMGSNDILTPNIDALSQQGVICDDAHVAATVSSPSRACLITGRYGHRFGYECNPSHANNGMEKDEQTIGDIFQQYGYATAAIGKWHLGNAYEEHPNRRGFELFYGMKAGSREYFYNSKGSDRPGNMRNLLLNDKVVKFDGYLTDRFTDKAVEFISQTNKPFMLYLSYNAVHAPMQATKEDLARFKGHPRQRLAAMTWALDRGVGRVVETLKKTGKYDNTLIFFLSDNGGSTINDACNYPLKGFKGNKFEGGHRVPFFVVWNRKLPGKMHYDGLVSSLDIFSTAMDAANIRKSKHQLDGVSLLPYFKGEKQGQPHEYLCWRKMDTRAVREGDYKLIATLGVDTVLYNIHDDLHEVVNLKERKPEVTQRLLRKLANWEQEVCTPPRWVETGWRKRTNKIHQLLMENKITTPQNWNEWKGPRK